MLSKTPNSSLTAVHVPDLRGFLVLLSTVIELTRSACCVIQAPGGLLLYDEIFEIHDVFFIFYYDFLFIFLF